MPEFLDPFRGVIPDRKLTRRELTRALRLSLAAEEEATHLYEALADATDDELAAAVLQDIADEERVHKGEFQRLLSILLPDEDAYLAEGKAEVDEMAEGLGEKQEPEQQEEGEPEGESGPPSIGDLKE
jgi:rubrerythrin